MGHGFSATSHGRHCNRLPGCSCASCWALHLFYWLCMSCMAPGRDLISPPHEERYQGHVVFKTLLMYTSPDCLPCSHREVPCHTPVMCDM
jgi:hypothetical protein